MWAFLKTDWNTHRSFKDMGATLYNHQFLINSFVGNYQRLYKDTVAADNPFLIHNELTVSYAEEMSRLPGLSATSVS